MITKPKKVLIIGSGPIIIGQAAEFDYAGTQACKAMREEGVISVLVNSNPATIMTDEEIADIVYIEPLTVEMITRIIERERPDGLLPTFGGQTGLNLAVALADAGVLEKYNVRPLGTSIDTIRTAEDRELFKKLLLKIGEPVPQSATVTTLEDARKIAGEIGLPVVIRPSFTLGGTGGGMAHTWEELDTIVTGGLMASPTHQVLVEKSVAGWKEIEYEVMRDAADTCITVCCMENFDPVGIHTGDSIVIAPSQTLTSNEYQMLRSASLKIIRALKIEGGCNVQFALNPTSNEYVVIEVNPRVSRSSALASKATGYPIARVASKIAFGKRLDEIPNAITGKTLASFEPTVDYIVVKIPRWPFDKFASGDRLLGTQMKATGEVMAIDRTFEAALGKAIRSLEFGKKTLLWEDPHWETNESQFDYSKATDIRLWAIMAALRRGITPEIIANKTKIDLWFLSKMLNIVNMEKRLLSQTLNPELMLEAKRMGFSDVTIGTLSDKLPAQVRQLRHEWGVIPVYKMVDTCAAEFNATTPYFYSTYELENEAIPAPVKKAVVIGSGPIRIAQGIEFDYCSVHSSWVLRKAGYQSIMANSNPETVSTDFDTSDRLYFEALDTESLLDILENEGSGDGCKEPPSIVQFGGQTAINLAEPLTCAGMPLLGSSSETIDLAEDRGRFEAFLSGLGIPQAPGAAVTNIEEALRTADLIGYPVVVRPSYVLGGRAMEIVHDASDLARYMKAAAELDTGHRILIDKYLFGKECEIDAVADGETVFIPGVMEHIERTGVHSGDSMAVYPSQNLTSSEIDTIVDYSVRMGLGLGIMGLMNVQFVVMHENGESKVYVLELNPRASRTIPFISKVTGIPMVDLATNVMLGQSLKEQGYYTGLNPIRDLVAIKAPVFSMSKLTGVDTYLGPEMKSTGEVMGIDHDFKAALGKTLLAAGLMLPQRGKLLISIADRDKAEALPIIRHLHKNGYSFFATEGTAVMIEADGMPVNVITKKLSEGHPNVVDIIRDGTVDGVVNTMTGGRVPQRDGFEIRRAAAEKRIPCFTSLDTIAALSQVLDGSSHIYNVKTLPNYRNNKNA